MQRSGRSIFRVSFQGLQIVFSREGSPLNPRPQCASRLKFWHNFIQTINSSFLSSERQHLGPPFDSRNHPLAKSGSAAPCQLGGPAAYGAQGAVPGARSRDLRNAESLRDLLAFRLVYVFREPLDAIVSYFHHRINQAHARNHDGPTSRTSGFADGIFPFRVESGC